MTDGVIRRDVQTDCMYTRTRVGVILTWKSRSAFNKRNPKTFLAGKRGTAPTVTRFIHLSAHRTRTVKLPRNREFTFSRVGKWNLIFLSTLFLVRFIRHYDRETYLYWRRKLICEVFCCPLITTVRIILFFVLLHNST